MVIKIILSATVVLFVLGVVVSLVAMCFEDTETFRAIDEMIARLIKGEEDDNEAD